VGNRTARPRGDNGTKEKTKKKSEKKNAEGGGTGGTGKGLEGVEWTEKDRRGAVTGENFV